MFELAEYPLLGIMIIYSIFIFIESIKYSQNQSDDLLDIKIQIKGTSIGKATISNSIKELFNHEVLSLDGNKKYRLQSIILTVNRANSILRLIGYLPLIFLVICGTISALFKLSIIIEGSITPILSQYFFYGCLIINIFYLGYKLYIKVPIYLIDLNPKYKEKPMWKVLCNTYPLWDKK